MFKHFSTFCTALAGLAVLAGVNNVVAQNLPDTGKASVVWQYYNTKQYDGDKRLYSEDDLYPPYAIKGQASDSAVTHYLRLLRNEIFARHGKEFKDIVLQHFFDDMTWYVASNSEPVLNVPETINVTTIKKETTKYEKLVEDQIVKKSEAAIVDIVQEKYTKDVLISARVGKEPGEYGVLWDTPMGENYAIGPAKYLVTTTGYIYILDEANYRIQKYDISGRFCGVVLQEKNDKLCRIYDFAINDNQEILVFNKRLLLLDPRLKPEYQMEVKKYSSDGKLVSTQRVGNQEEADLLLGHNVAKNNNKIKENINLPIWAKTTEVIAQLADGSMFIGTVREENYEHKLYVLKYNSQGNLISTVIIPNENNIDVDQNIFVDVQGNIYSMDAISDPLSTPKYRGQSYYNTLFVVYKYGRQ